MKVVKITKSNMRNYESFLKKQGVVQGNTTYPSHTYVSDGTYKQMERELRLVCKKENPYMPKLGIDNAVAFYMLNIAPCICKGLPNGYMLIDTKSVEKEMHEDQKRNIIEGND